MKGLLTKKKYVVAAVVTVITILNALIQRKPVTSEEMNVIYMFWGGVLGLDGAEGMAASIGKRNQ